MSQRTKSQSMKSTSSDLARRQADVCEGAAHRWQIIPGPIEFQRIEAGIGEREPACSFLRGMCRCDAGISDGLRSQCRARLGGEELRDYARRRARIVDIDDWPRAVISGESLPGITGRRSPADQERYFEPCRSISAAT